MTVVVLGIDALDPELVDTDENPHLTLNTHTSIDTILSSATGGPSTHELWPTIITGLPPDKHGLQLEEGITWENPILNIGSSFANTFLPSGTRSKIGAWLLQNTGESAFRTPASYYEDNNISTMFEDVTASTIGIPNYVVDPDEEDREHDLRKDLGDLFRHDPTLEEEHKHLSSDPREFYEVCLEMSMIRVARTRRALRSRNYQLVFGYTSGLDLIGHVSYDMPELQDQAYRELNDFVGELRSDLREHDELVLISDHGLQNGIHTDKAMMAATKSSIPAGVTSLTDFRDAIESELTTGPHDLENTEKRRGDIDDSKSEEVRQHLEDLGYM